MRRPFRAPFRFLAGAALVAIGYSLLALLRRVDSSTALGAFVQGSVGSPDAFLSATLVRATPLLLTGLAVVLAFRAGVLNIGGEGQLLAGASAASALGVTLPLPSFLVLPLTLAGAALAGGACATVPAVLHRRYGAAVVITTIMMNFVAGHLVSYLVRGPMQESSHIYPQSTTLPPQLRLPLLVPGSRLHVGFALGLLAAVLIWFILRHTASGFRLRVTGANADAAATAGLVPVNRVVSRTLVVSGALAGLAGGVEVTGVTFALYENLSPGYGYSAVGVALLAGLEPLWVVPSAILFGALDAGAAAMQRNAGVPAGLVAGVEAGLILTVLAARELSSRRLNAAPELPHG